MKALVAARIFDGTTVKGPSAVLIEDGLVCGVVGEDDLPAGTDVETVQDLLLTPGFVDLQVNGGGGVMFNDAPSVETLRIIAEAHARMGTTAILPTLISSDRNTRILAMNVVREARAGLVQGIAGLHLEGPFLAPSRKGIHPESALTIPDAMDMAALTASFDGCLLVTLAPEVVPLSRIEALADAGGVVFAGHTEASFDQAMDGFDAGVVGTTHLFNAMSAFGSRAPGMVGAAFQRGFAGIIADLVHVHPATISAAYRCMGAERLFFVSDAMATSGSDCVSFQIDSREIRLVNGRLTDAQGTLAGAHLSMGEAVRRAVTYCGIPLEAALRMATRTPADVAGLSTHGRIAPGSRADFVALDATHAVRAVWRGGMRLAGATGWPG